jgi:hypothetical protein
MHETYGARANCPDHTGATPLGVKGSSLSPAPVTAPVRSMCGAAALELGQCEHYFAHARVLAAAHVLGLSLGEK